VGILCWRGTCGFLIWLFVQPRLITAGDVIVLRFPAVDVGHPGHERTEFLGVDLKGKSVSEK